MTIMLSCRQLGGYYLFVRAAMHFCIGQDCCDATCLGSAVSFSALHQLFDGLYALNTAARAGELAVDGCCGAGEVELAIERPTLQEAIDESGMEDVTCACGVNYRDAIGATVEDFLTVPCGDAIGAERCCCELAVESRAQLFERAVQVGVAGDLVWEVAADDQVIDERKKLVDAFVLF